jgi:hypothetical protein
MSCDLVKLLFVVGFNVGVVSLTLAQSVNPIDAPGESTLAKFHAQGAQIYECKVANDGTLAWQFREPIATLILDGKTIGRHYTGPSWEHVDGSTVMAKPMATKPGATPADIPWLKLEIVAHRGTGIFGDATTVQRINTQGGVTAGACDKAGSFRSVPYAADYVFLRKGY